MRATTRAPARSPNRPAVRPAPASSTAADALAAELRATIRGEVRFDAGSRALYATDASNYRQVPIGVVLPRDVEDVVRVVAVCRRHGAPVLPRGGGTSLAGQCCNVAVVLDLSKYLHRVLEIDPDGRRARVQPGTILDDLRSAAERHHLTFGPDPATHNRCTLGGMIGNNSCGVHSIMAGLTSDNVEELEVLTYDGLRLRVGPTSDAELRRIVGEGGRRAEIYTGLAALRDRYADLIRTRYPDIPRRVSGYNLVDLLLERGFHVGRALVGSEGTCVTVLEATVRLVDSPPARALAVLGFPDVAIACDHVPEILGHQPIGVEGFDDRMVDGMKKKALLPAEVARLPEGGGWLLVEFGADRPEEARSRARDLIDALGRRGRPPSACLFDSPEDQAAIWKVRESGLGATAVVPGEPRAWPGWEDSAVPPEKLGAYLRDLRQLLDRYGYRGSFYGHIGQGCTHVRVDFDFASPDGRAAFRAFMEDAADLVVSYGGSLSGEHGDGQARAELLPRMFGPELIEAFRAFKRIWDPDGRMNPGKVVDPAPLDTHLRLGPDVAPPRPATRFSFAEDGGSFTSATLRCVGVGLCRRLEGGTMCPSFMVTREEEHSTRGRARLLFEMLRGDVLRDGWRDEHVKDALDLCLACKGCKGDCPVNVDMATYKAEFLSHYYAGRLRPRSAYAFGLIMYWARLAALAPALVNQLTRTSGLRSATTWAAGIAPEREIPAFARRTFQQWIRRRGPRTERRRSVVLWPDTFTNHFQPRIAVAAVEVLEAAGFQVGVPTRALCCGRPLYDYGMLGLARRLLRQCLDTLRPALRAGLPVVVLEPSCAAVFRDELLNLLPDDPDARRLHDQTVLLSELLERGAPGYQPPTLRGRALMQGHCHQRAIMTLDDEARLLARLGLDAEILDAGCCGMAGGFGFEAGEHYEVSRKVGEHGVLPAVRAAAPDTLILADGFSCREQIAQLTGRRALHLAEVLALAEHQERGQGRVRARALATAAGGTDRG